MLQKKLNLPLKRYMSVFALGLTMSTTAVHAAYPDKLITFTNPYAAGGPSDILGRLIAERMSQILGQSIIVQNRPGAGAAIGASYVARSKPDGYNVLIGTAAAHVVSPMLAETNYDGVEDFQFIGMLGNISNVLTVNPSTDVDSVKTLIEQSKASPERFSYASAGAGTSPHITGENFKLNTGAKMLHVPYKGAAPATTDMVSGVIDVGFINLPAVLPFIQSDKLSALAIAAGKRSTALPDVPTFAELGYQGFEGSSWYSLAVPTGTPADVVETLHSALTEALQDPDIQQKLEQQGVEDFQMTGPQAQTFILEDQARIRKILESAGLIK